MPDLRNFLASATAASILVLILFAAVYADPLSAKKNHTPQQDEPLRFQNIHCAAVLGNSPCSLDPAMRQLEGLPPQEPPRLVPMPDPSVFMPAR